MSKASGKFYIPPIAGVRLIECRDHLVLAPVYSFREFYGYGKVKASEVIIELEDGTTEPFWDNCTPNEEAWAVVPDFVIVVGLLLGAWFTYLKSEVTLTDRRLIFRTGYLSRRSGEVPLENVESIYISEPLIGRMCGYGTVMVTTVGAARFALWFIATPQEFHFMLQKAVLNAKNSIRCISKPPESGLARQDDDSRYKPKG